MLKMVFSNKKEPDKESRVSNNISIVQSNNLVHAHLPAYGIAYGISDI